VPRRHLSPGQRAVGEVVERTFAERRLVDRIGGPRRFAGIRTRQGHRHEHRVVRRADDPPDDLDRAVAEDGEVGGRVEHRPAAQLTY
jgi:hypothetical protein